MKAFRFYGLLIILIIVVVGCRESAQPTPTPSQDVQISITSDPNPPVMGDAKLLVTITDAQGNALEATEVKVRGDMNHAGMAPEFGDPAEKTDAGYSVAFNWSMGGDWIITVDVTLSDGRTFSQEFDFSVTS